MSIPLAFQVRLGGGSYVLAMWVLAAWEWIEYLWKAWGVVWIRMRSPPDVNGPAEDWKVDVVIE